MNTEYELSLTRNYRSHWSVADAIREFVQNFLDDDSTSEWGFPNGHMFLRNKGAQLCPSSLLLGVTSKSDEEESVGGFGEGYKIGLLILLREGYNVTIRNRGLLWTPKFKVSEKFKGEELLCIEEREIEDDGDLTFIIEGITEELKEEVIENCLYLQEDLGETIDTEMGRILLDTEGKLFVGGLYVTDTDNLHSYDFHPQYLKLNTDRKTVESWSLKSATARIWKEADLPDKVALMVDEQYPDVIGFEWCIDAGHDIKEACYLLHSGKYTQDVVVADNTSDKEDLEKRGFTNVKVTGNSLLNSIVKKSSGYVAEDEEPEVEEVLSPIEYLEEMVNDNEGVFNEEGLAVITKIIEEFNKRGVDWDE